MNANICLEVSPWVIKSMQAHGFCVLFVVLSKMPTQDFIGMQIIHIEKQLILLLFLLFFTFPGRNYKGLCQMYQNV